MFNHYDTLFWTFLIFRKKKKKEDKVVNDDGEFQQLRRGLRKGETFSFLLSVVNIEIVLGL